MINVFLQLGKLSFNGFDDWIPEEVVLEIGGRKKSLKKDQPISYSTSAKIHSTATVLISRGFDDLLIKENLQVKLISRRIVKEGQDCHLMVTSKDGQIQGEFILPNAKRERRPPTSEIATLAELVSQLLIGKKSRTK